MSVSNKVIDVDDLNQEDVNKVVNLLLEKLNLKLVKQTENCYGEHTPSVNFQIVPKDKEIPKQQNWFDDEGQDGL